MFWAEFRYAIRQLQKAPGFTLLAILTLAFGIGASTAIFTLVDSVVLRPLGYKDSGRLVVLWERVKFLETPYVGANPRHADVWQRQASAFQNITLLQPRNSGVALGNDHPQIMSTLRASPNVLDVLRVQPVLGRSFRPEDGVKGREDVTILSHSLWQKLFHADPGAIGETIRIDGVPRVIIGVLPESFRFSTPVGASSAVLVHAAEVDRSPQLIVPVALNLNQYNWNGEYGNWTAIGRLKPGVSVAQAEAQLNVLQTHVVNLMPASERDDQPNALLSYVQPMREAVVQGLSLQLWLLMAAVLGLMLIACVNLANAQLGRALSREREAAVRSALGASSWQLLTTSLFESLVLAFAGGVGGILLAFEAIALFKRYTPIDLPRLGEVHPDARVLAFAIALMGGCAVLFGILPALHFVRADPQRALQNNTARTAGSRESRHLRRWLIALEVFGSTALLLVTGLFARSLFHLISTDKGFHTAHVVAAEVNLSGASYREDPTRLAFDDATLRSLRDLPGVESVSLVSAMPLEGETWIDGIFRTDKPSAKPPLANVRWISPGYFQTIREPIVAGRYFDDRDAAQRTVLISQAAARAAWPGEDPIGRKIHREDHDYTVVGIVADAHNNSLKLAPAHMLYFHFHDNAPNPVIFLVRSRLSNDQMIPTVRRAIWSQGPQVVISRIKSLDAQLSDSLAAERFETVVLSGFGAAALLLAMLGVYGVLSYSVAARRQEIGVRMALGATRRTIYGLTMREAFLPVAVGLAAGWLVSLALARLVASLLYGVSGVDWETTVLVLALFVVAAMLAAFLPARRAASIDPMQALRTT